MIRSEHPRRPTFRHAACLLACAVATSAHCADDLFVGDFEDSPAACPDGRLTESRLCYRYAYFGNDCTASQEDITEFASIWGRNAPRAAIEPFPGLNYYTVIQAGVGPGRYLAAHFVVSEDLPTNEIGMVTHGETFPGPAITSAISTHCGDFTPANAQCGPVENSGAGDPMARWKITGQQGQGCPLVQGRSYYLNVKISDPLDCDAQACLVTINNNRTP